MQERQRNPRGRITVGLPPRVAELLRLRRPATARDPLAGGPAPAGATLSVLLDTPRGPVTLHSLPPAQTLSPETSP